MPKPSAFRLTLVGVGAMNSPRYAPAGLLVEYGSVRVMIDGGPGAVTRRKVSAWLVTDERSELFREIRKLSQRPVVHTSHPTCGYLIRAAAKKIVWAPEFLVFPTWARGADLMFAEAAGWKRPILFRGQVGGHACVDQVAGDARKHKVKRLVFAHIGRPTIRAIDAGERPAFGEVGVDGDVYRLKEDESFSRRRKSRRVKCANFLTDMRESSHLFRDKVCFSRSSKQKR